MLGILFCAVAPTLLPLVLSFSFISKVKMRLNFFFPYGGASYKLPRPEHLLVDLKESQI